MNEINQKNTIALQQAIVDLQNRNGTLVNKVDLLNAHLAAMQARLSALEIQFNFLLASSKGTGSTVKS